MAKTNVDIQGRHFRINGQMTYSEIPGSSVAVHGLLMNARFIQGVFDDRADRGRYNRWGRTFDPEAHTDALIEALPQWRARGLRGFTVGFQGGGPCFTVNNASIDNNPFGAEGKSIDPAYAGRMDRLIRGADECGLVVIVSFFYGSQAVRLKDGKAVRNAVIAAARFLREGGYGNVLIEVANEYNISAFKDHALLYYPEGMAALIELAQQESGGLPTGCSGGGGHINREVAAASDYVLIHGNGCSRQRFYNMVRQVESWQLGRPIVCNEDSQAIGQLEVALKTGVSWGYYNNMTKQEPPADWSITPGEDTFFAWRMARGLGLEVAEIPFEEQYYLQGLEADMAYGGQRWLRLASLFPESIDYVDFYRDGVLVYTAYDEPFSVNFISNWRQGGVGAEGKEWRAKIHLRSGEVLEKAGQG